MKVKISELKLLMLNSLKYLKLSSKQNECIVNHFLNAELSGKTTHGVGKFCWEKQFFKERKGNPFIEIDKKTVLLVDANKEIGPLAAQYVINLLIKRVKKYNIALIGMKNSQRYGSLDTWASKLANNGLIGIIMNTSEPLVPHPDATLGVLGTNPMGIGIPTNKYPIIVDMATSEEPMGLTWQMMRENKKLPDNIFYNDDGKYTTDPKLATSVKVFGGYKGFNISLLIQILSTSFLGLPNIVKDKYDIGYVFIAINPSVFISMDEFTKNTTKITRTIKSSEKNIVNKKIFIPGEHAEEIRKNALKNGYMTIPEITWQNLTKDRNE